MRDNDFGMPITKLPDPAIDIVIVDVANTGRQTNPGGKSNMSLTDPITGTERREIGGVQLDVAQAGSCRVKRLIYPAGFRWSTHLKGIVGTDYCMHAHVGFLAQGQINVEYPDGCRLEFTAPQILAIEPGHEGWVVGDEPAVVIEFDFERDTIRKLGMPAEHGH